jgi:tetratricopeptide (TPR) repeat protein
MRLIFFSFRNLSFILFLSFLLVYSERPVFAQNYFNYNPGVKKTFNSVLTLDTISRFISEAQVSEVWLNSIDINSDDLYGLLNRANDKIQEGYFYEALSDIEKAFIIDSTLSESFLLKGICLMNLGQPDSAEVELNNAIRIDNNNALAYNIRGRIRLISDQITLSENDFLHSLELDNSLGDSYYFLALIKISEYEYVKATKYLKRCIGLMPDFPEAYIALSNLYKLQHQPHASLKTISEGIERMPSNPVLLMVRGTTYLNDEDYKSASTDFNTVLEIEPMNFIGLLMRGTLYSIKQEYNSAYADFYNALKGDSKIGRNFVDSNVKKQVCAQTNISPNYFTYDSLRYGKYWSYYQRALCSYLINDYETSLRNLNIILVDEPQFYQPYELRAAIHRIKRNPRKAADDIEKSFEIRGDSSIHDIMNLALLYYWIKDYPKASKYLTLAITHEPDNPDLYYYLARINFYQNNLEASISYYEKVLFYLPDYQDVLFQLAQAKNQLGNYEEALEDYYKVLEKDSSNLELTLIIAEVLNKLKLYNETISLLNKYLKLDQGNLDVYVYLGDTYSLLEDYENALIYYSKVEQALSGNFDVIYSVAKTHLYLGDTLSAKQIIERELENQMAYHYKHNRGISTLHYYLSDCYSSPNEKINQLSKAIKFHESSVYYF